MDDIEGGHKKMDFNAAGQIIGVFILEFGVLLHRYGDLSIHIELLTHPLPLRSLLIGLTLAVDPNFKILFVVIIFHRECYQHSVITVTVADTILQKLSRALELVLVSRT